MKRTKFELKLEVNGKGTVDVQPLQNVGILTTPPIGEDYWLMRVPVSDTQAVVAFPKFSTLGIGFQKEEDWNTNLPYLVPTDAIYNHIKHNKGDRAIPAARVKAAIQMLREAAYKLRPDKPLWTEEDMLKI